jgi:hypothetical protein
MKTDLKHGLITDQILRVFYEVYNELGHGFLESVYHRSLVLALESVGLNVSSKVPIPVWFRVRGLVALRRTYCKKVRAAGTKSRPCAGFVPPSATYELFESYRN